MSHTIDLIAVPVPDDNDAAWALRTELVEAIEQHEDAIHPDLQTFIDRMLERFPEGMDVSPVAYGEYPLRAQFGGDAGSFNLIYGAITETFPAVLEIAGALGITVFDGQAGSIFRPGEWGESLDEKVAGFEEWNEQIAAADERTRREQSARRPWWRIW